MSHLLPTARRAVAIIALLLTVMPLHAASTANIEKVWLEHGVTVNNKKAMKVYVKFTVKGQKDKQTRVCVWVESPKGTSHKVDDTSNNAYNSPHFVSYLKPKWDDTRWDKFSRVIYLDELKLKPGKHSYHLFVTINDANGACLRRSEYITFDGTGSSNTPSQARQSNRQPQQQASGGQPQTWREELGYGGFVVVTRYPNGYTTRVRWRLCPNCQGTKMCGGCRGTRACGICQGRGGIITAGYGNWLPCAMCGQTGLCNLCKGTGACVCAGFDYPGYVIGSTSTITPDGGVSRESADYGSGRSSSGSSGSSSGSSSKKTCPDCGGTRLWHQGRTPEYAQPVSQLVGHFNPSGTKCRYCGNYDKHWHSKCATCKHYSGTTNPYR